MSNYVPGYQKRNRLFSKRVRELEHAIKSEVDPDKLVAAVESVRAAKLSALRAQREAPSKNRIGDLDAQEHRWRTMTPQEIISKAVNASSIEASSAKKRE